MSLSLSEHEALKGIPGNVVVFAQLSQFFQKYNAMTVKNKFILYDVCPEYHKDAWLWYIHKTLCRQNIEDTLEYLEKLMIH